jgi:hypothetical protein
MPNMSMSVIQPDRQTSVTEKPGVSREIFAPDFGA